MAALRDLAGSAELRHVSDYLHVARRIRSEVNAKEVSEGDRVRIAVIPSFTATGLSDVLTVLCASADLLAEVYVSPYNQHVQAVLDPASDLYRHDPDIVFLFVDSLTLLGEQFFRPSAISDEERRTWITTSVDHLGALADRIREQSRAKVVLHNCDVPASTSLGILESKQACGVVEAVQDLNRRLRDRFRSDPRVYIFDHDRFCSRLGKAVTFDWKYYYLGDMRFSMPCFPDLCREYMAYIKPLKARGRKCIVLDLDNTLWGGIIGEDGLRGIQLGPTREGRPFWEFQKALLALYDRGIIMAINSRNNPSDALEAIRSHPYMVLKEEHFAAIRINWEDKVSNLRGIAAELDIGLDSLAFIDDDLATREMVASELPEVMVVAMPADPARFVATLAGINDFSMLRITEEDRTKGRMYADQRKRREFEQSATDLTGFLRGLGTEVTIAGATPFTVPRISQLTLKTNQFNMTTRRYQEEDISRFLREGNFLVVSLSVRDKFGDSGLTGVAIAEKSGESWRLDSFLLSCRVIGRRIEEALLAYVAEEAQKSGALRLVGELIPTKKNIPARDFFRRTGFTLVREENGMQIWELDISRPFPYPDFILVVKE